MSPETLILIGRVLGAGFALGLGGIGAAIGMGMAAGQADQGIMRQPIQHGLMLRTMLIGQAVGGSPSIFALVIGLLILFLGPTDPDAAGWNYVAVMIAAGLTIGLGCLGSGVGCGWPAGSACDGVARNPRGGGQLTQFMVIGQAVAQSPAIFATVVALILIFLFKDVPGSDWFTAGITLAAGLAMGASALGPGLGSGWTAGGAVDGMGRFPESRTLTLRTMLVGQGVCETPAIFGLLVTLILLFAAPLDATFIDFAKAVGAGIAVGFGGIGPGIGSGIAGSAGCNMTAMRPSHEGLLMRTMLIGQAVSQSTSIYALIIALVLIYVV